MSADKIDQVISFSLNMLAKKDIKRLELAGIIKLQLFAKYIRNLLGFTKNLDLK